MVHFAQTIRYTPFKLLQTRIYLELLVLKVGFQFVTIQITHRITIHRLFGACFLFRTAKYPLAILSTMLPDLCSLNNPLFC
ncbi:hypothetical protein IPC9_05345 [Pseudomonas aeruginosa]|nr:hypothetical protein IPC9_05345 [Pseudomonas aeruginosa]